MKSTWAKACDEQEAQEIDKNYYPQVCRLQENISTSDDISSEKCVPTSELSLMRKILHTKPFESQNNIEVYCKNGKNPFCSIKTFEELGLKKNLIQGVYDLGYSLPSDIQGVVLPALLADPPVDMIAQSQSGTGKTAAFSLALLSRIDTSKNCLQALCLSPTMELALQTLDFMKRLAKHCTDITIRSGVKKDRVPQGSKITDHIVIGTPGKLVDWATKYKVLDLCTCKMFVYDEADVMIDIQGHQQKSLRIQKGLPKNCQLMMFSATYNQEVFDLADAIMKDPVILRLPKEEITLENIKQLYVVCENAEEKYEAICSLYSIPVGNAIFFCNTKVHALWLETTLKRDGHQVGLLTGDRTAEERNEVLRRFREGTERVLICTNVVARGIDVITVSLVVNYDLPCMAGNKIADCVTYLHRIGRTGRFGKTGLAVNVISGSNDLMLLKEIEEYFDIKIHRLNYNDIDEILKLDI